LDVRAPNKGVVASDEFRELSRERATQYFSIEENRQKHGSLISAAVSNPTSRQKRSDAVKARWKDDGYKENFSSKFKEWASTEEGRDHFERLATRSRKPITINGITYGSQKEAAEQLGIRIETLKSRLRYGYSKWVVT
jgi:DNA-directed RNA polymerase specialized sigma24 family protein